RQRSGSRTARGRAKQAQTGGHVLHNTWANLGMGGKTSNNGKGGVTACDSESDGSNYPGSHRGSTAGVSSCVASSDGRGERRTGGVNRSGSTVKRNGPSQSSVGRGGAQAPRAQQKSDVVEPRSQVMLTSVEAVDKPPLSDQAESKSIPQSSVLGNVQGGCKEEETVSSTSAPLPCAPRSEKPEVVTGGNGERLKRKSNVVFDPINCERTIYFDKDKPSTSIFKTNS
ncbi:unnamed protein product, partial [Scytosiphon promiscuus]